jgi:hypothetical protein
MTPRRPRTYRYRTTFDAPLPFVFRWCTDYSPTDPKLEHEAFERRIIERTSKRIVYEDLEQLPKGWSWRRHLVTLRPPNRWSSESVGNYRDFHLEYELRALPGGRTEMRFRGRRVPAVLGGPNPSVRAFGESMETSWRYFRKDLEREYRRSLSHRASRSPARRR